jgi:hypothetical protein
MTLLLFLRSSNGSAAPGPSDWQDDEIDVSRKRRKKIKVGTIEEIERERLLKRREEEELLLLYLLDGEFDA